MKLNEQKICECGKCGLIVGPGKRFINGHNRTNCHLTQEHKDRNRDAQLGRHPSIETLKDRSVSAKAVWGRPGYREKMSQIQKDASKKPGVHEKRSKSAKEVAARPGEKGKFYGHPDIVDYENNTVREQWREYFAA